MRNAAAVMRAIVEIFNTGDVDAVPSLFANDYVDHQGLDGMEIRGPDGFCQVVAASRGSVEDLEVTIEDLIASDEKVVSRLRWVWTDENGTANVRETIEILHLREGRVVEHWGAAITE